MLRLASLRFLVLAFAAEGPVAAANTLRVARRPDASGRLSVFPPASRSRHYRSTPAPQLADRTSYESVAMVSNYGQSTAGGALSESDVARPRTAGTR